MAEIWVMPDRTVKRSAGAGERVVTAGYKVGTEKVSRKIRVRKACLSYCGSDDTEAGTKTSYETIIRRKDQLPRYRN